MSSSRSSSLNGYGCLDIRKTDSRTGSLLVGGVSGSPGSMTMNSYKNIPLWENTRRIKVLQEFRPAQPIVKLRHYRKLAFLLIALIVLAGFQPEPAKTQDIEQLRKDAEQGNASAQYSLGVMYNNGEGVPQDHQEAVIWWRKAAEQGNVKAQYSLGVSYDTGEGVPQATSKPTSGLTWQLHELKRTRRTSG